MSVRETVPRVGGNRSYYCLENIYKLSHNCFDVWVPAPSISEAVQRWKNWVWIEDPSFTGEPTKIELVARYDRIAWTVNIT